MLIELDAWEQNSKLKPKASLHKAGRAAARPLHGRRPKAASFMEAGSRPEFGIFLPRIEFFMHLILCANPRKLDAWN